MPIDRNERDDLERPDSWDFENAATHEASKPARAVVSVAFRRDDLRRVSEAAQEEGMKVSEYIRNAAIAKARQPRAGGISAVVTTTIGGFLQGSRSIGTRGQSIVGSRNTVTEVITVKKD
jgi:hypothetical protein